MRWLRFPNLTIFLTCCLSSQNFSYKFTESFNLAFRWVLFFFLINNNTSLSIHGGLTASLLNVSSSTLNWGTQKGARSKMPVLTIWICCSVLGGLYKLCICTLCKKRPAYFPKIRQNGNSEASFNYSVIFKLGPYMYLLFILWANIIRYAYY